MEIVPTPAGADIITFFRNGIPQVSLLRDTLGDVHAGAHRFRQVWEFAYGRPTWKQNTAAALPFFYHRAGANDGSGRGMPAPLMDLSQPEKGSVGRLAETIIQADGIDGRGILFRAPTRAYRGNSLDYRNMFLARSLEIVNQGTAPERLPGDLSSEDWDEVQGRLFLATHLLGGFVSNERAERISGKLVTESSEDREANWDLLRQAAEKSGLYIEALGDRLDGPRVAIVWFAQTERGRLGNFDSKFLGIADPWQNDKPRNWEGYTVTWHLDRDDAVADSQQAGVRAVRMIPLALYALDYPGVPLLLIDFQSDRAKRREIVRRGASEAITSVLGWTAWGNLSYFTAKATYSWYRNRHGAAFNRSMRLAAYARLRQMLLDGRSWMDPAFHALLERRLDQIALNPFEQGTGREAALSQRQYEALMNWAHDPEGLAKTLARDRAAEYYRETHGAGTRVLAGTLRVATLGQWKPYRSADPEMLSILAKNRRLESALRLLKQMDAAPEPEVEWEPEQIREAASEVKSLAGGDAEARAMADRVLGRVHASEPPSISLVNEPLPAVGQ